MRKLQLSSEPKLNLQRRLSLAGSSVDPGASVVDSGSVVSGSGASVVVSGLGASVVVSGLGASVVVGAGVGVLVQLKENVLFS